MTSRDLFINEKCVSAPCSVKQVSVSVLCHMTYIVAQLFTKVQLNEAVIEQECSVNLAPPKLFSVDRL